MVLSAKRRLQRDQGILLGIQGLVILCLVLCIAWPVVGLLIKSLTPDGQLSLDYYRQIFTGRNIGLVSNSLKVALTSCIGSLVIAFFMDLYIYTAAPGAKSRMKTFQMLTLISPPFVASIAYIMLFGRRGLITYGLFGLSVSPYGFIGIVTLQIIGSASFAAMMLYPSFEAIDQRLIQAALDLGAKSGVVLRKVILPSVKPGLLSVGFMLFSLFLADFGTPVVIGGSYKVLASQAYIEVISYANIGKASAICALMFPVALASFLFYIKSLKATRASLGIKTADSSTPFHLDGPIGFLGKFFFWGFVVVIALKYFNIVLSAVTTNSSGHLEFSDYAINNLGRKWVPSLINSFVYCAIAALGSVCLGILLSWFSHRKNSALMEGCEFIASLPYAIPGAFFGLAYVVAFSGAPFSLQGTAAIVILNLMFRQVSRADQLAGAQFCTMDQNLDKAVADLGCSRLVALIKIYLPSQLSSFIYSFIAIFTSSLTSVGAVIFLVAPSTNLASVQLFNCITDGEYGIASVMSIILILGALLINIPFIRMQKADNYGKNYSSN